MIKSKATVLRELKRLRKYIDKENDPIKKRMAYHAETVLTWAFKNTEGWNKPLEESIAEAEMLRKELKQVKE